MRARARATRWACPPELDELEHLCHPALELVLPDSLPTQAEGDILVDRQVGEEGVVLEDGIDVAPIGGQPGDVLALELDQTGCWLLEAADHAERCRLAATGRSEKAEELAVANLEVDVIDGGGLAEFLDHVGEPDRDFWHSVGSPSPGLRVDGDSARPGESGRTQTDRQAPPDRQLGSRRIGGIGRGCQETEVQPNRGIRATRFVPTPRRFIEGRTG